MALLTQPFGDGWRQIHVDQKAHERYARITSSCASQAA